MKYEVKAGREFDGIKVTVVVEQKPEKEGLTLLKAGVVLLIAAMVVLAVVSIAIGYATGDFSLAKSIVEGGKEVIFAFAKLAKAAE